MLGIVIVNYGSSGLLAGQRLAFDDSRVIVVDNRSTEAEARAVAELCAERGWALVASPANIGFGPAVDLGAAHAVEAGCDELLILNPDAEIEAADLAALRASLRDRPRAIISPVIMLPGRERVWFRGATLDWESGIAHHDDVAPDGSDWITAACIVMTTTTWRTNGGFDPDFFLYWEDVDFTYRWKRAGGELRVEPAATAVHAVGGTQGGGAKSPAYIRYNLRNRRLFAARNGGAALRLRWSLSTWRYVRHLAAVSRLEHPLRSWEAFLKPALTGILEPLPARRRG